MERNIIDQAKKEIKEESFREKVELAKEKLRKKKPILHKIFPFKIVRR